jgi:spermidine/putrescine transport system ATP-binding protein
MPTAARDGLRLEAVSKRYGTVEVLHPLDLAVGANEFVTILGPSGSGKTTVLRLVGGFTEPTTGRIRLDGLDITDLPINRRPCHTVFQDYALFPHMTVTENVGYGLMVRRVAREEIGRRVREVLAIVGLTELAGRYPAQLSGGQRQRTALARAIVLEPKLVLLDEPLAALDAGLRRQMQEFLKALQRRFKTAFLFVTHDQEEAITMADRIVVMRQGTIEQVGTPQAVYWKPRTAFVAGFFGDNNLIEVEAEPASGGGSLAVSGPLGRFAVPAATAAAAAAEAQGGGRLLLALRPESLQLLADAGAVPPGLQAIAGEVVDLVFTGPTSRLAVALPGLPDQPLRVQLTSRPAGGELVPGTPVRLAFRPADVTLVPLR